MFVFIIMNFIISLSGILFNGILDRIAQVMEINTVQTGGLTSFYAYGAIGAPVLILILGNMNRNRILKTMLLGTMIFGILSILTNNFQILLFARFMAGFFGTAYGVIAITTIASLSSNKNVGRNIVLLISGASAALMIGIPLCRILIEYFSWQMIYLVLVILMGGGLLSYTILLPESKTNTVKIDLNKEWKLLSTPKVWSIILASFIVFVGYGAFYTYLTPYLIELFPQIEPYTSGIIVFVGACALILNSIGGYICDRIGFARALLYGTELQIFVGFLIFITQNNMVVNILYVFLWMITGWFIGLQLNTGINVVSQKRSNFIVSLSGSIIQFSQAVGASISAIVINQFGMSMIIFISMITSLLCVIFCLLQTIQKQAAIITSENI